MASAHAQSPIVGAFGVELDKPFDITQAGVVESEDKDNTYSFTPSKENISPLFDSYEVTLSVISKKVLLISANNKKKVKQAVCRENLNLLQPILANKYKLPIHYFENRTLTKNSGYYLNKNKIDISTGTIKAITTKPIGKLITVHCENTEIDDKYPYLETSTMVIQYFSGELSAYQKEVVQLREQKLNESMHKYKMF